MSFDCYDSISHVKITVGLKVCLFPEGVSVDEPSPKVSDHFKFTFVQSSTK